MGAAKIPTILRGLMDDRIAPQIKENLLRFETWREKKLKLWQMKVLEMVLNQTDREVLWIVDVVGNKGKTFLSKYLAVMYGFAYVDGNVCARDLPPLIGKGSEGVVMDVSRTGLHNFEYGCLESVKNGAITSGKYRGIRIFCRSMKVLVCSNGFPMTTCLSQDRWNVVSLDGNFCPTYSDEPVHVPSRMFPFKEPVSFPDLSEEFNLCDFLAARLNPIDEWEEENAMNLRTGHDRNTIVVETNIHTSQTPGPSNVGNLQRSLGEDFNIFGMSIFY